MAIEDTKLSRRRSLQLFGLGVASTGLFVLGACKGNSSGGGSEPAAAAGTGCDTPVDEQSRANRRTFQYMEKAAVPEKNCAACVQFEPEKYGACGGCKVITGPVKPAGGCLAFAPKAGDGGAPAKL